MIRKAIGLLVCCFSVAIGANARARWTELNIGPFYVDTDGDTGAARDALTQLEQLRWVLGGMLESKDLPSVWPIRIVLSNSEKTNPKPEFVWQNAYYLLAIPPGSRVPVDEIAGILLDSNTPRLPEEVESGLRELFGTLQAKGSRVTWGGTPAHPDLAWARMQLLATKFEYYSDFHIFMATLKTGSTLRSAEQNAFGKDYGIIEKQAAANLAAGHWEPVSVSGRPLDPKRDFGEHSLDESIAAVYLADAKVASNPKQAEAAYKSAIEAGGAARALGFGGLAAAAKISHEDPQPSLDNAIRAGSKSAPIFVAAAENVPADQALKLLKKAAQLNPLWAEPVYREAQLASDPSDKEKLLKQAVQLDPRATQYWIELAHVQTDRGEATAAQGTWLRAENSGATEAERDRIHQMRLDSERQRLDAAEDARRREREAIHLEDERAQEAEADRIRAAEQRANAATGSEKPETVVPWNEMVPNKKLDGILVHVDCLDKADRLVVREKNGGTLQLLWKDPASNGVSCGDQKPARRISVTYAAQADERFQTAGTIVTVRIQ